jgi:para-nitrobenzyl esterase
VIFDLHLLNLILEIMHWEHSTQLLQLLLAYNLEARLLRPLVQATHTAEIPFVFGNTQDILYAPTNTACSLNPSEQAISQALIEAWTFLAVTGDPSTSDLQWPKWDATESLGINIVNSTSLGVVNYTACQFWDSLDSILAFLTNLTRNSTTNATTSGTPSKSGSPPKSSSTPSAASETVSLSAFSVRVAFLLLLVEMISLL